MNWGRRTLMVRRPVGTHTESPCMAAEIPKLSIVHDSFGETTTGQMAIHVSPFVHWQNS